MSEGFNPRGCRARLDAVLTRLTLFSPRSPRRPPPAACTPARLRAQRAPALPPRLAGYRVLRSAPSSVRQWCAPPFRLLRVEAQRLTCALSCVCRLFLCGQAAPEVGKIRIKLRSYEHKSLGEAVSAIIAAASTTGAKVAGPIPLPTRRRLYCVLRSPHVNKNSMEHFQLLTHQRLIDVKNPSAQTIDALMQLDMPAGVDIEVKL